MQFGGGDRNRTHGFLAVHNFIICPVELLVKFGQSVHNFIFGGKKRRLENQRLAGGSVHNFILSLQLCVPYQLSSLHTFKVPDIHLKFATKLEFKVADDRRRPRTIKPVTDN